MMIISIVIYFTNMSALAYLVYSLCSKRENVSKSFYLSKSVCADSEVCSGSEGMGVGEGASFSPLRFST